MTEDGSHLYPIAVTPFWLSGINLLRMFCIGT